MRDRVNIVSVEPLFRVLSESVRHNGGHHLMLKGCIRYAIHHGIIVFTLDFLIKHKFSAMNRGLLKSNRNIGNSRNSIFMGTKCDIKKIYYPYFHHHIFIAPQIRLS